MYSKLCPIFPLNVVQTQAVYLADWVLGPTVVTVDLSYVDIRQVRYMDYDIINNYCNLLVKLCRVCYTFVRCDCTMYIYRY